MADNGQEAPEKTAEKLPDPAEKQPEGTEEQRGEDVDESLQGTPAVPVKIKPVVSDNVQEPGPNEVYGAAEERVQETLKAVGPGMIRLYDETGRRSQKAEEEKQKITDSSTRTEIAVDIALKEMRGAFERVKDERDRVSAGIEGVRETAIDQSEALELKKQIELLCRVAKTNEVSPEALMDRLQETQLEGEELKASVERLARELKEANNMLAEQESIIASMNNRLKERTEGSARDNLAAVTEKMMRRVENIENGTQNRSTEEEERAELQRLRRSQESSSLARNWSSCPQSTTTTTWGTPFNPLRNEVRDERVRAQLPSLGRFNGRMEKGLVASWNDFCDGFTVRYGHLPVQEARTVLREHLTDRARDTFRLLRDNIAACSSLKDILTVMGTELGGASQYAKLDKARRLRALRPSSDQPLRSFFAEFEELTTHLGVDFQTKEAARATELLAVFSNDRRFSDLLRISDSPGTTYSDLKHHLEREEYIAESKSRQSQGAKQESRPVGVRTTVILDRQPQ